MRKYPFALAAILCAKSLLSQICPLPHITGLKTAISDKAITYDMRHEFHLYSDNFLSPKVFSVSFNHAWAKESAGSNFQSEPSVQPATFNTYGFNFLDPDNNIFNNLLNVGVGGVTAFWDSVEMNNATLNYDKHVFAIYKNTSASANGCITIEDGDFTSGCSGEILNYGFSQAISDSTCHAEAYSFSVAGVTVVDDESLLSGSIDWLPGFICEKKGKGHTIVQKSGTNDPVYYYVKDSATGNYTSGLLLSIRFTFYTGNDTISQINYWQNDTVHIESDSSEFSIIFPSQLTSLKDTLIIKVNGNAVSSITKTGTYAGFTGVQVGSALPLNFILKDTISFHYNLDSLSNLSAHGIPSDDSLSVKLFMFGNCENNYALDEKQISMVTNAVNVSCSGANNGSLAVSVQNGLTPYTYQWNNGATTSTISSLTAGVYTVTVSDIAGCTASVSVSVTEPASIFITGTVTNSSCPLTPDGVIDITVSGGVAPFTYYWSNGSTVALANNLSVGTYTVTVTDSGGCTQSAAYTVSNTSVAPSPPTTIIGSLVACKNSTGNIYTTPIVAGASSYIWTVGPGGFISTGNGTNSISVNWSSVTINGSITVTTSNACGNSAPKTLNYKASGVPAMPGYISGQSTGVCTGSNFTYYIAAVPTATSYMWTVPSGATIVSGQGTRVIIVSYSNSFITTGTITVRALNSCGTGATRSLTIAAKPKSPTISGLNFACPYQTGVQYSVAPVAGATSYTWTVVTGSHIVSGQGTTTITVNWGGINGSILCKANNACGSSTQASLGVSFTCKETATNENLTSVSVLPNPAQSIFTLEFDASNSATCFVEIYTCSGLLLQKENFMCAEGMNKRGFDIVDFSAGMYFVKLNCNGSITTKKLMITR